MECKRYFIKVTGSIIAKNGSHFAQGWAAGGIDSLFDHFKEKEFPGQNYTFNEATNTINGDLILDNTTRLIPYATYYAMQGVVDFTCGESPSTRGITCMPGFAPSGEYYDRTITEIRHLLGVCMDPAAEDAYIRGLYVSVFGAFELFLRDFIMCGIFNFDDCYTRAVEYFNFEGSHGQLEKKICDKINKIVFHNFNRVQNIMKTILGIDIPEHGQLSKLLKKRNDIVHRYAYTQMNGMQKINVSRNDVRKLILECNKFKKSLLENSNLIS